MYKENPSTPLGIRTRRPVHNHALVGTADIGLSTSSGQGDATLVPYRLWAHSFHSASGAPAQKRAFS